MQQYYLTSITYNFKARPSIALGAQVLARQNRDGKWDVIRLAKTPVQVGQAEFILTDAERETLERDVLV